MCGRFTMRLTAEELNSPFGCPKLRGFRTELEREIAPGEWIVVVRPERSERVIDVAAWGFTPSWAKTPKEGPRPINAKGETLATNGLFRRAFSSGQRCLIPAQGFIEWVKDASDRKRPVLIRREDGEVFALAGVWDHWRRPKNQPAPQPGPEKPSYVVDLDRLTEMDSAAIITVPANGLVSEVHHRMPAILPPEHWDAWLDPAFTDLAALEAMLKPAPKDLLELAPMA